MPRMKQLGILLAGIAPGVAGAHAPQARVAAARVEPRRADLAGTNGGAVENGGGYDPERKPGDERTRLQADSAV